MSDDTDTFKYFCAKLDNYPTISREVEEELVRKMKLGDRAAHDKLFCHHLRLVVGIAKTQFGHVRAGRVKPMDLVQIGCIGLLKAIKKFEPERGFRLYTFAKYQIRTDMSKYALQKSHNMVRIPQHHHNYLYFFQRAALMQIVATTDPDKKEELRQDLLRSTGMTRKQLDWCEGLTCSYDVSTNKNIHPKDKNVSSGSFTVGDTLTYPKQQVYEDPELTVERNDTRDKLSTVISMLNPREACIIKERFINPNVTTLDKLGTRFGMSRERVRMIQNGALGKMRRALERQGIDNSNNLLG